LFHERRFDESEQYLKEALSILKKANQEQSLGYLYLLKRLAYVSFTNRKYADAEKYFKVTVDMVPTITKNPVNIYNTRKNLLLLYTHSNIAKANEFGEFMMKDSDDYLPLNVKDLTFMMANVSMLNGDHSKAKSMYRHILKQAPKP
jgi:tetratricopeptide (TPR) repeat protein